MGEHHPVRCSAGSGLVVRVERLPFKALAGFNGNVDEWFNGKDATNGPELNAGDRLIAGNGHTDAETTFAKYRVPAKRCDGEAWFAIFPPTP